jgi:putative methanogenesis marker 16 metalloprotein
MKSIDGINQKIAKGTAVVCTASELKKRFAEGEKISSANVDVVTTGTFGIMSGTMAVLHIPVTKPGTFRSAERVWLNGVPAVPGPCPNEGLGSVDLMVYGTARRDRLYGGGHLFRDIVEGNEIAVEVESGGMKYSRKVTLAEMGHARIITTRSAFKNYLAVVNTGTETIRTIFSVKGLTGPFTEASVSGCGDINPLQNDPCMSVIGSGMKILLNGSTGFIMGQGTRCSPEKPNIAAFADMKTMIPEMMGGILTSLGPECNTSVAIPIPVLNDQILKNLLVTNRQIPLPVAEVRDRVPFAATSYADVWEGTDPVITSTPASCIRCEPCGAAALCPASAILPDRSIDSGHCVNCGTCVKECPGGVFKGNIGSLKVDKREIPITLRQSDRARALQLCELLKTRILDREFTLTEKNGDLL